MENDFKSTGTNGVEDGLANVRQFEVWVQSVTDFKPYVHQGDLNSSLMARESGLKRGVFYTNTTIRESLLPKLRLQLEKEGVLLPRVALPSQVVVRDRGRVPADEARIKQTQEENESLKAENRELREQLKRFKGVTEALHATGRLPW